MKAGLLDVLVGRFSDGEYVSGVSEDEHQLRSIISNLTYLFNTRRGSLPHLPEFGLPDITEIYRDVPDSVLKLRKSLKEAVEQFEPRLRRVRIEPKTTDPYEMRLVFLVSGELPDRRQVRFQTTFSSTEATAVAPFRHD
jgi:type VI secretion system protein